MKKAEVKSGSKQVQLKSLALREGFILEHRLQKGRTFVSVWEPTEKAYQRLNLNKPSFSSKGGYLHKFIAYHVRLLAREKGLTANIEYRLSNNKAIDVMVRDKENITFYEIVTSKPYEKELVNIRKDFDTSLQPDCLIFLVTDNKVKKEFSALIELTDIPSSIKEKNEIQIAGNYIVS